MAEMKTGSPEDKPKKRLRMSVVCLNCKARKIKCDKKRPSCTNCIRCNVGHLCEYEPPHWVNRVTTSSGTPIVALKEAERKQREVEAANSSAAQPTVGSQADTILPRLSPQSPTTHDEIRRLREQLAKLEQSVGLTSSEAPYSTSVYDEDNNDTVDFYELYYSLVVKRSGMEEHKPLSSLSHYKKDQYFMIMVGYFNLCGTLYKAKYGDLKRRAGNKKARLDASLTEFLYLLGEKESPEVVQIVSRFIKERIPKNQPKNNHFPNMGEVRDTETQDSIKHQAEKLLPPKNIVRMYMDRFYKYIYPYFPFIDRSFFDERIFNSILVSDNEISPVSVLIEERSDFIILSTLLIILRFTYVALPQTLSDENKIFTSHPISAQYVATAMAGLSLFKLMRKTKLTIIQALMYYRLYCNFAPEDGDGAELTQSQILFATIVQSSYSIGLNRDASRHKQMNYDKDYADLWRRLWLGILEVDKFHSTIAGHIPIIQNLNSYELRFPDLGDNAKPVDTTMNAEYKRSQRILKLYFDLANMVTNFANAPKVCELVDLIRQMNVYVNINYNCDEMVALMNVPPHERNAQNFTNVKRLQHTFQTKALTLTVYHAICIHYESVQNQNVAKLKQYQAHLLHTTVDLANLLHKFLTNGFNEFIDENHKYFLHRFSENMLQRVMNSFISILTRVYHTLDLISRGIGSQILVYPLQETANYFFRVASAMNVLMQNTLGTTYYQAFKTSLKYKFYLRSLRKDGYKCIRDTMNFLTDKFPDDPVARLSLLQRLDLKSNPHTVLQDLDTMNCFVNYSVSELDRWKNIVLSCTILEDPILSSENIIWEPSFKTLPIAELYGDAHSVTDTSVPTPSSSNFMGGLTVDDLVNNDMAASGIINLDEMMGVDDNIDLSGYGDLFKSSEMNAEWLFKL